MATLRGAHPADPLRAASCHIHIQQAFRPCLNNISPPSPFLSISARRFPSGGGGTGIDGRPLRAEGAFLPD